VVLFADGFGGKTRHVHFQAIEKSCQFAGSEDQACMALAIEEIVEGERKFIEALLPESTRHFVSQVLRIHAAPLSEFGTFNIGYVAGDKVFFHPDTSVVGRYGLPDRHLVPAVTSGKQLRGCGLRTSQLRYRADCLYLPSVGGKLSAAELEYVAEGEVRGIDRRYKCAVRKPWFRVPGVRVPDLLLSVFSECPIMVTNDAGYVASNSLLCGFLQSGTVEELVAGWYTSLTLLQLEIQVHALGGGVMILVPGEVAKLRLPRCAPDKAHLENLDKLLSSGNVEAAYGCGDEAVLRRQLGFDDEQIGNLREGIRRLRQWRNSSTTSR
jgi:adenine-specific DNA-methyltransferase